MNRRRLDFFLEVETVLFFELNICGCISKLQFSSKHGNLIIVAGFYGNSFAVSRSKDNKLADLILKGQLPDFFSCDTRHYALGID